MFASRAEMRYVAEEKDLPREKFSDGLTPLLGCTHALISINTFEWIGDRRENQTCLKSKSFDTIDD